MAAITLCSDFGAPQNKVWHCFHCTQLHTPISCVRIFIPNISPVNNECSFAFHIFLKRIDFSSVLGSKKMIEYCLFRNSINHVLQLQSVEVYLSFSNCLLSICYLKSNAITQKMIDFLNHCCSVAKLCLTLCDPTTAASQPSLSFTISQSLLNFHVHWVTDAIQPSHSLSLPSPSAVNLSQNQGLFQWVSSSHQMAKVLELQLQQQSFQWVFRIGFL